MKPRKPLRRVSLMKRSGKPLPKVNPRQERKRKARYTKLLAAGKHRPGYQQAMERSRGRCEFRFLAFPFARCPETDGLEAHHLSYRRLGNENAADFQILCKRHHEIVESEFPSRRHSGRSRRAA
jgi:hypothetical protein